jgi:hypothetical protein
MHEDRHRPIIDPNRASRKTGGIYQSITYGFDRFLTNIPASRCEAAEPHHEVFFLSHLGLLAPGTHKAIFNQSILKP